MITPYQTYPLDSKHATVAGHLDGFLTLYRLHPHVMILQRGRSEHVSLLFSHVAIIVRELRAVGYHEFYIAQLQMFLLLAHKDRRMTGWILLQPIGRLLLVCTWIVVSGE